MIRQLSLNLCLFASALMAAACGQASRLSQAADSGVALELPGATCLDSDGDGVKGTGNCAGEKVVDCDDKDRFVHPGATELCNGKDDDCDGKIDVGAKLQAFYRDEDGDTIGGEKLGEGCQPPAGAVRAFGDCNDKDRAVHPGATELCNGIDDNCDGNFDEGLGAKDFYVDADGDKYGSSKDTPTRSCESSVPGKVANNTDCDDGNSDVHPGATEVCNQIDDDCNNKVDDGPNNTYYPDVDGDTFGDKTAAPEISCSPVAGKVNDNTDCDDSSRDIKPGAVEACNDKDDNCDGTKDEGNPGGGASCATGLQGVCAAGTMTCTAGAVQCVQTTASSAEKCNALDDDCNGQADETFADIGQACTVGQGACVSNGVRACNADGSGTTCNAPGGLPTPAACDGNDNDCDGVIDEPTLGTTDGVSTGTPAVAWQDIEVAPFYYSPESCGGGANGSGTDALAGGMMALAGGGAGIWAQPLTAAGAPQGGAKRLRPDSYVDVALAQVGDGFLIAGIDSSRTSIDLYSVDASGSMRTYLYYALTGPSGCNPVQTTCNSLDSLRVVRGNGRRVTVLWRDASQGLMSAQVELCDGGSKIRKAGCGSGFSIQKLVAGSSLQPGLGAASAIEGWGAAQTCAPTSAKRRLGVAYRPSAATISFFQLDEDGANKSGDTAVASVTGPRSLTEPEVGFFKDGSSAEQYAVSYVSKNPTAATPEAELVYWLTNAPTSHTAYAAAATAQGVDSISRPRLSATANRIWLTAVRSVADAAGQQQVMARQLDVTGAKVPAGTEVEVSVTAGSCGSNAACRAGNKSALTSLGVFGRLYYTADGAAAGSYSSTLSCD